MTNAGLCGTVLLLAMTASGCGMEGMGDEETVAELGTIEEALGKGSAPAGGPAAAGDFTTACPLGGTLPRIVRLSEVLVDGAGNPKECNNQLELQNIIFGVGRFGRLILDKTCTLNAGIRLPNPFTLSGVNIEGAGTLAFTHDGIGVSVCQEGARTSVTIEDVAIYGPAPASQPGAAPNSIGVALANLNMIHLNRVRISNFHVGLEGFSSFSVFIDDSNISDNRLDNIIVGYNSNGWRIRDGLSSQAGRYGINVLGPGDDDPIINADGAGHDADGSNDLLIDGVRMESNRRAAIRTAAHSTRIVNNRFEGNGKAVLTGYRPAVVVTNKAVEARVLTNLGWSNKVDCLDIDSSTTQSAFNMPGNIVCDKLGLAPP